jgi:hypothetical protein
MRAIIVWLALLVPPPLFSQQAVPRFMYIYRDSLKRGVDSAYRVIENDAARICADLRCPNPYLALEALSGPHEAWLSSRRTHDAPFFCRFSASASHVASFSSCAAYRAHPCAVLCQR